MRFSLIIPVYNVEKYLNKCIDSILSQTYKDFELIIIDDGSSDSSRQICDEYANKYNFIKVVHKKNEGLAAVWMKEGLDLVNGDYIGSIDSDDWVDSNLLERISNVVDKCLPDIIVYGYKNVDKNGEQINKISARKGYYNKKDIELKLLPNLINSGGFRNRNCFYLSRVNKFVRKDLLLKNRKYYDSRFSFGEDNFWTIPNVLAANSIYVYSDWYPYSYRINPTQTIHTYHEGLWEKFNNLAKAEISILRSFDKEWMCDQVYNDMVVHAAISINNVMRGKIKGRNAIREIYKIVNNYGLQKGLRNIKYDKCSLCEKINVILMKMKATHIIYLLKTIQYSFR